MTPDAGKPVGESGAVFTECCCRRSRAMATREAREGSIQLNLPLIGLRFCIVLWAWREKFSRLLFFVEGSELLLLVD